MALSNLKRIITGFLSAGTSLSLLSAPPRVRLLTEPALVDKIINLLAQAAGTKGHSSRAEGDQG